MTHLERHGQVVWEQPSFLDQSPPRLTPSSWSSLGLSCKVVWVAWDREAGRGLGTDKTISKLLFNSENLLIGLYCKFCVLGGCQSHVGVGCSAGALGAIREGEHGRAGAEHVASAAERAAPAGSLSDTSVPW